MRAFRAGTLSASGGGHYWPGRCKSYLWRTARRAGPTFGLDPMRTFRVTRQTAELRAITVVELVAAKTVRCLTETVPLGFDPVRAPSDGC